MAKERQQLKKKYHERTILVLMKCIRTLLRELMIKKAEQKTQTGDHKWEVDDYLRHNRRRIERKIMKIDENDRYRHILYPRDAKKKTDFGKWDLTLYVFILTEIVMVKGKLKKYLQGVVGIRNEICRSKQSVVTRNVWKVYMKRIEKAKKLLYKEINDKDLKNTVKRRLRKIENGQMNDEDIKYVLDRWMELECKERENRSGKSAVDRFYTVETMLSEVCCEVMQAVVKKRARDKGHQGLDSFLRKNATRIRRQIHTLDNLGRQEEILLPRKGETKIVDWEPSLLCWVLLNVCYLGDIKVDGHSIVADAIGTIRIIRNETTHMRDITLSQKTYDTYMEDMQRCVRDCLHFLHDDELSEDINDQIEDLLNGDTDPEEIIRRCRIFNKKQRAKHELEKSHLEDQANIQRELSEIVKKFKGVELPGCEVELMIENCGEECSQMVSKLLVEKINEVISRPVPTSGDARMETATSDDSEMATSESDDIEMATATSEDDKLTLAIVNLIDTWKSKGWNPKSAIQGSVLLEIKCTNFSTLMDFYNTYRQDGSTLHVNEIQDAVRRLTGEHVKLHFVMYDIEMFRCMEMIVSGLLEKINAHSTRSRSTNTNYGSRADILMTPFYKEANDTTPEVSSLTCKDVNDQLERVAGILRKRTGLMSCSIGINSRILDIQQVQQETDTVTDRENVRCTRISDNNDSYQKLECNIELPPEMKSTHTTINEDIKPSADYVIEEFDLQQVQQETDTFASGENENCTQNTDNNDSCQKLEGNIELPRAMESDYRKLREELREDLIQLYKTSYHTIPISPLFEESDVPLLDFYIIPTWKKVEKVEESKTDDLKSLADIFSKGGKPISEIYVMANAGLGKTVFCKYLVQLWCQAHQPDDSFSIYFSDPDSKLEEMKKFEFSFLIPMRDEQANHCAIDQMIHSSICQLSRSQHYSDKEVTNILDTSKFLVILDGLDEWSSPSSCTCSSSLKERHIPHRNIRENCTVLTTTRPWKLSFVSPARIDRQIELTFPEEGVLQQTAERVILKLNDKNKTEKDPAAFRRVISEQEIESWSMPLVLGPLLYLWYHDQPLHKSVSEVYSSSLRFLVKHAKHHPENAQLMSQFGNFAQSEDTHSNLLSGKKEYKYDEFIFVLGQIAFEGLFSDDQNSSLIFHKMDVESKLSDCELSLALSTGILVKKDQAILFVHKTYLEFLAALYISRKNVSPQEFISKCNSVDKILSTSTMLVFLSGLDHSKVTEMFSVLRSLISNDDCSVLYRRLPGGNILTLRMFALQSLMIDCLEENMNCRTETILLPLTDVVFIFSTLCDSCCRDYLTKIENVMEAQNHDINSVYLEFLSGNGVNRLNQTPSTREFLRTVEVATFCIMPTVFLKSEDVLNYISMSTCVQEAAVNAVLKCDRLESISCIGITLSHKQWYKLYKHIVELRCLQNVNFRGCVCSTHGIKCDVIQDLAHI